MTQRIEFITEMKNEISQNDQISLRSLYTPVVGTHATLLYSLLCDYNQMNKGNNSYIPFGDLAATLQVSETQLIIERKKLEAVGLVRVFEKADNKHFIISINKPLDATSFRRNSLLFKECVAKIGELIFERVEFSLMKKEFNKDEFAEVTTKFQDMFDISKSNNVENTMEMAIPSFKNKDEAINGLVATQFVKFLTGEKASPSQMSILQGIQNLGFSSKSINLIIDYSFEINGKVVANHIKSIAEDLFKKEFLDAAAVEGELVSARTSKKTSIKTFAIEIKPKEVASDNREWEDLFDSLGGI